MVADVMKPLLDIDLFHNYGLLIDCGNFTILDPNTDLRLNFVSCEVPFPIFFHTSVPSTVVDQLLREFPNLTSAFNPLYNSGSSSRVIHWLENLGCSPYFCQSEAPCGGQAGHR